MKIINESNEFITQELLKALLLYNKDTGEFIRKVTTGSKAKIGTHSGYITENGYIEVIIHSRKYKAHRLAWLYIHGKFPDNEIDHIDGDRLNNAISNLREATTQQNAYNKAISANNSTGFKGVSLDKRCGKYRAYITVNKAQKSLGYYDTAEEAGAAYVRAAKKLHGEFFNENTM